MQIHSSAFFDGQHICSQIEEDKQLIDRLSSFSNWPPLWSLTSEHGTSPSILSAAGFMYSGNEDAIICTVCRLEIRVMSDSELTKENLGDRITLRQMHLIRSPECSLAHVLNCHTHRPPLKSYCRDCQHQQRNSVITNLPYPLSNNCSASATEGQKASSTPEMQMETGVNRSSPTHTDLEALRDERVRLSTFDEGWTLTTSCSRVNQRELAANGLFYTGRADRVQCAFCRGILHRWNTDDIPADEHRRYFPECPLIRRPLEVGNIPIVERMDISTSTSDSHSHSSSKVAQPPKTTLYKPERSTESKIVSFFTMFV